MKGKVAVQILLTLQDGRVLIGKTLHNVKGHLYRLKHWFCDAPTWTSRTDHVIDRGKLDSLSHLLVKVFELMFGHVP